MKVFNDVYGVEIPSVQDAQIKKMQSLVDTIQGELHKSTAGYYNDSLYEDEMICKEIIGEFWYNNEIDENTPKYSDEIGKENDKLIAMLEEQLVDIRKMVKIEILMDEL